MELLDDFKLIIKGNYSTNFSDLVSIQIATIICIKQVNKSTYNNCYVTKALNC